MNTEKEKNPEAAVQNEDVTSNLIRELGLLSLGNEFKSDVQYISIIGSIEGHSVLPPENKTTKYMFFEPCADGRRRRCPWRKNRADR